ncbi:hypothetical protein [Nocardioides sp. GXQ0305]|uniref:hypothetical protein n=1 Tax=Nocardioides sp. GXQ0305 TaxID=3423912 RepID=UPI003D7CB7C8
MNRRVPLFVAVVGALLIGGATTGTTRASWVDQGNLQAARVSSGTMGLAGSATPAGISVDRGSSATTLVTVSDTSSTAARNLRQRMTPSLTGSLPSGVTASLTTSNGSNCGTASQGPVDLNPGGSTTMCVTVTASSSTAATSANVNVAFSGAQVRGGTVAGWTTPQQTVTIPVSIAANLMLSCGGSVNPGPQYRLTWNDVDADAYVVYRSSNPNGPWQTVGLTGRNTLQYVEDQWSTSQQSYFAVQAIDNWSVTLTSNVLSVRRSGNSNTFTCGAP